VSGMRILRICRNVPDLWLFRKAGSALQKRYHSLCPSYPGYETRSISGGQRQRLPGERNRETTFSIV